MKARMCGRLNEARMTVRLEKSVDDMFSVFKVLPTSVAAEGVRYRVHEEREMHGGQVR